MEIVEKNIDDIIPYDSNPRDNKLAIDKVLESLKLHGQVKPIVLSAKGKPFEQEVICAGHTTYQAMMKFGAKKINCVVMPFDSEEQFVDYNIRDNKTGEFALWDEDLLGKLNDDFNLDLKEMGFLDIGKGADVNKGEENEEWEGMPEFEAGESSIKLVFHFDSELDRDWETHLF